MENSLKPRKKYAVHPRRRKSRFYECVYTHTGMTRSEVNDGTALLLSVPACYGLMLLVGYGMLWGWW